MHNLLLLLGTALVASRQPQLWGHTVCPVCGVSMAVSLHCNTTHKHISEIHGVSSGAVGTGNASALILGAPCTPHGAGGCGNGSPGHMCPLCHQPPLWHGDQGDFLQWGGPTQLGSHPSPSQRPSPAISPVPHCTFLLFLEGVGAVALPGLWHIPGEPPVQILLAGAAGVMLQP